jgi:ribosomal protein S15P/S13E
MRDFPYNGDAQATRRWLDEKGYNQAFQGFEADLLLLLTREELNEHLSSHGYDADNQLRLWLYLKKVKEEKGAHYQLLISSDVNSCYSF